MPPNQENARVNDAIAAIVDRGIEFHKTLGKTVAMAYFKENHVPDAVIKRILGTSTPRRAPQQTPLRRC